MFYSSFPHSIPSPSLSFPLLPSLSPSLSSTPSPLPLFPSSFHSLPSLSSTASRSPPPPLWLYSGFHYILYSRNLLIPCSICDIYDLNVYISKSCMGTAIVSTGFNPQQLYWHAHNTGRESGLGLPVAMHNMPGLIRTLLCQPSILDYVPAQCTHTCTQLKTPFPRLFTISLPEIQHTPLTYTLNYPSTCNVITKTCRLCFPGVYFLSNSFRNSKLYNIRVYQLHNRQHCPAGVQWTLSGVGMRWTGGLV